MSESMKQYIQGDIHDVIKTLDDDSIDFIYTDPPFGTTKARWDTPLDWDKLFPQMWRVLKPDGIICLYASIPFTYELLRHETPRYHYSWKKNNSTGFFTVKKQPLRCMEEIFIYYRMSGTYNPQMVGDVFHQKRTLQCGSKTQSYWGETTEKCESERVKVSCQGKGHKGRYPTTCQEWKLRKDDTGITRTDEHIDYFIKTYSNENDTILDMTCHNEYVGSRCESLHRSYIGVDLYLNIE